MQEQKLSKPSWLRVKAPQGLVYKETQEIDFFDTKFVVDEMAAKEAAEKK